MADPSESKQGPNGAPDEARKRLTKPDPAGYFEGESMTRRHAFTVGGQALGGIAGLAVILPAVGFAVAPLFEEEGNTWQSVGPVELFDEETYRSVVITAVPDIGEAGKTTAYVRRGSPDLAEDENGYVAITTRCAHLGCPVRFVQSAGNFICPCHGGVYDFEGKVIGGPPVRPLDRFQTRLVDSKGEVKPDGAGPEPGDQVEIGPRFSVTSQLEPVRARDPGEFTGGIWEYLYPPRPSVPPPP
ncbi:MAG: QcrA and Rieske domain-containing protein [Solirubrobacterales bacterium]